MLTTLATLGLLVAALATSPPVVLDTNLVGLVLATLVLEGAAVRLPLLGCYSAACLPALSIALTRPGLGGLAVGAGCLGLLVRTLRLGRRSWQADGLALAVAGLLANLNSPLRAPLAVAAYLALHPLVSRHLARRQQPGDYIAWLRLQNVVDEMRLLCAVASLGLSRCGALAPWSWTLVLPALATHRAVRYGLFRLQAQDAQRALDSLESLQRTLETAHQEQRELLAGQEEKLFLEELSAGLAGQSDLKAACDYLIGLGARRVRATTWAIFDGSGERLTSPGPYPGPTGSVETLVQLAWQQKTPQLLRNVQLAALAVPLGCWVLYLGRSQPPLTEAECRAAMWLAARATPLLLSLREKVSQREHSLVLEGQVDLLADLLQAARQLSSSLEPDRLYEYAQSASETLLPGQAGALCLGNQVVRSWGQPLPLHQLQDQTGLLKLEGWPEVLVVPLNAFPGVWVIASRQAGVYHRDAQDTLGLVAQQLGLALANVEHLRQVVEAQAQTIQNSKMTAVAQLAAGVAHELNTPLGAVVLGLDSIRPLLESPTKVDRASRAVQRCQDIVGKLLIYTRLGVGSRQALDVSELVEDTLSFFHAPLNLEGYRLERDLSPQLRVYGQAQELQQMLVNLLLNAKEASQELAIRSVPSDSRVLLQVIDQGQGMDAVTLQRAFEPFFTTKVIGKNVGLGLSVAREIARQHGGDIKLESKPGVGTRVTVSLPRAE